MKARPIRILHVTASEHGGAGVACMRLHHALRDLGVDSRVLLRTRTGATGDDGVLQSESRWIATLRMRLDRLPLRWYPDRNVFAWWSVNWVTGGFGIPQGDWQPDILHLHWIGDGFVPIRRLAGLRKPLVWTMHDMWPFTGGCHYSSSCERYQTGCGACPQLGSTSDRDLSSRSVHRKRRAWSRVRGVAVSPSRWLAKVAEQSLVLRNARIESIPNGLDGNLFRPRNRCEARQRLGLQSEDKVLLTGAAGTLTDGRKGFPALADALRLCAERRVTGQWRLLVFGASDGPGMETLGLPATYFGTLRTGMELVALYEAADAFALPSLQDNLPNTVVESLACGTPVVAFRTAGPAEMVADGKTGRLAEPFSAASLADAICDAMAKGGAWRDACRSEFERTYAWPQPAQQYLRLYNELA